MLFVLACDKQGSGLIATNAEEKRYIQATESMNKPTTRERELAPPRIIRTTTRFCYALFYGVWVY